MNEERKNRCVSKVKGGPDHVGSCIVALGF